jgi:hypothetical protein
LKGKNDFYVNGREIPIGMDFLTSQQIREAAIVCSDKLVTSLFALLLRNF